MKITKYFYKNQPMWKDSKQKITMLKGKQIKIGLNNECLHTIGYECLLLDVILFINVNNILINNTNITLVYNS